MYADGGKSINHVEVVIEKVSAKPTKKGGVYYSLNVSDMMDEHATVVVWEEDYKIFQKELVEGNLVNLLLDAPDSGYHTYKLNSPPLWERRKIPAFPCANTAHFADVMALDKTMDFRVVELEKGSYVPPVKVQKSDEDDVPVVLIF